MKTICVTGCLGFIGSHFTRLALNRGWRVWGVDKKTYAARGAYLEEFRSSRFHFTQADIADLGHLYEVDAIVNFAAETHVDNSIMDSTRFLKSNIMGVQNLLELARAKRNYEIPLFVQVSTDEVYGDGGDRPHLETDVLAPSNPYSASKVSAEMLVKAWHRTYEVPYVIVRPSNNFGLWQYPEKLIPKSIRCLTSGKAIPLHGDGSCVRSWLHVEDTCHALMMILESESRGTYNISGEASLSNLDLVRKIAAVHFREDRSLENYVKTGYVRPGQDVRYVIDDTLMRHLGWGPLKRLDAELPELVDHYRDNVGW